MHNGNGSTPTYSLLERLKNRGRDYTKLLYCPIDQAVLTVVDNQLVCEHGHHHYSRDGILFLLDDAQRGQFEEVAATRTATLAANGAVSPSEDAFRALPQTGLSGWPEGYWEARAFATAELWRFLEQVRREAELPPIGDVGTAVEFTGDMGWLGYGLDVGGYATVVVGQDAGRYGLAAYPYGRYPRVQAALTHAPLTAGHFDLVLYSYCLHQIDDFAATFQHGVSLLKRHGYLVVMDETAEGIEKAFATFTALGMDVRRQKVGGMGTRLQKLATTLKGGVSVPPLLIVQRATTSA